MAQGFLSDIRVLELADEKGEFCGKLLAGAGADVIKVEPPEGNATRRIGPFYQDVEDPEQSLYFWHYNFGKRGVALDVTTEEGRESLRSLVARSDVLLESHPPGYLDGLGLGYDALKEINPGLVMTSITPFGQTGPYRDWKASDLVHLAMGGVMMLTGYDPTPEGEYDTPPVAPQMWHSSHIVGSQTYSAIVAALLYRERTGQGQHIDASIHRAINCNTGTDIASWLSNHLPTKRQTARYGSSQMVPETLAMTKDGRHLLAFISSEFRLGREHRQWIEMLDKHDMADDLTDPKYQELEYVVRPDVSRHIHAVARRWVSGYKFDREVWREAQGRRLHWAPVRKPEENLDDPHWRERRTFTDGYHEDLSRSFTYTGAPWLSEECPWRTGPRAPRLGEHTNDVLGETAVRPAPKAPSPAIPGPRKTTGELPFAIDQVRILDLAWVVAGAAGPRILVALGAEDIRVEWKGRLDSMRTPGGAGVFADVNPGKRSIGLNLGTPKGIELLQELVRVCDIVVENFTARTLENFGITYDVLRKANPSIIYVQQPGFGKRGMYTDFLSSAPVGEAFTGLTEQSGFPVPYPPAGWGYLYLDWSASYYCAMGMLSALYHRAKTGRGQYIDGSLAEPGLYLTGTAILDSQANGGSWERIGNSSPYKPAAPHGAYRCLGEDRWIAIAVFTDEEWKGLASVLGDPAWTRDPKFATPSSRMQHTPELDTLLDNETQRWDPFELMLSLQAAEVPAGVCQTSEDRIERDPQLQHDGFLASLMSKDVGSRPIRPFPIRLSETPTRPGGILDRGFPSYAEDNDHVYGTLLGIPESERQALAEQDVI